jgi:hypothetical protein
MATMSESMHRFVEAKVAKAAEILGDERSATDGLAQLCGGPAEAGVNAAIGLLDQAIGGESL